MENIFENIAKLSNTTAEQVKAEIEDAIKIGMNSSDPTAQKFWAKIAPDGMPHAPKNTFGKAEHIA